MRSEKALAESEARFRSMADSAPVFIWVAGTDALCHYFNKPWLEFRGRTLQQESGNGWAEGIHPEDFKRTLDTYLTAFNGRKPFRMEYRLRRHDGAYRWLLDTGTPRFAPDGTFSGFIGSCLDVTDLKETEEQLRQSQKMEAVGRLAGGIAHDFNNLLTAINGYAELCLSKAQGDETLSEFLKEIKRSGERAAALTSQLLAYSRKQILSPRILNLNSTVAEMDRMLKRLIGEDIELVTMLEPELGWVLADPGQIQQIILNLALNARDAMPQGGRLTLETANVTLDSNYISTRLEAKPGPHIMLAVSDTGIGMTEEIKAKIFEPFFTTKEVGKGTGLGLSSVYGIIQQSGGSILVYSEPGQGTTFKIYLPIVEASDEGQPQAEAVDDRTLAGKETILIVEDEETVRTFIRRALTYFGYSILEAKDGKEALQAIESGKSIDLVLTDVVMPGMNGRQLATQLSARLPGAPILFMSGYTDNAIVHHGVLDADATFIQKPFSQSDLLKKIRGILDARGIKRDTSKFRAPRPSPS
jgi:PAS domain S-box-containing protein